MANNLEELEQERLKFEADYAQKKISREEYLALHLAYTERYYELIAPPQPKILGEISQAEANTLLRETLPKPSPYDRDPFFFSDTSYQLTTISDIKAFLEAAGINKLSYVVNFRDCDNFAAGLYGHLATEPGWENIAQALVWGNFPGLGPHAWNLVIACETERRIYFIEPQTNQVWEVAKETFKGLVIWLVVM